MYAALTGKLSKFGTKETIYETLESLSEDKFPNLEANKCHLRFTEI